MKKMFLFAVVALAATALSAQITVSPTQIEGVITPDTQRMELFEMSQAFEAQGVTMRYDRINYTTDWKLTAINLAVKFGDGEFVTYSTEELMDQGEVRIVIKPQAADKVCVGTDCE